MKSRYTLLTVLVVCLGILSNCTTLFDVAPKAIYSPINLKTSTVTYTQDAITIPTGTTTTVTNNATIVTPITTTVAVGNTTLKFTVKDPELTYAAVVFYDSTKASLLVKTNNLNAVSPYELYKEIVNNKSLERTIKVKTNPSRGQFQYIVPIGYNKQDSTKIYCAQGYARTKISPWSYMTDIYNGVTLDSIRLVQSNDGRRLSYISFNKSQFSAYTYSGATRSWVNSNSITLNKSALVYPYYSISSAYFVDNQYYVFVKKQPNERLANNPTAEFGVFKTDVTMSSASYTPISYDVLPPDAFLTHFSDKAATFLISLIRPILTTCQICYDRNLPNVAGYKYTFSSSSVTRSVSFPVDIVSQEPFTQDIVFTGGYRGNLYPTTVYKPTTMVMINDKIAMNRKKAEGDFRTYQTLPSSISITEVSRAPIGGSQVDGCLSYGSIISLSQGTESWVLDRCQQLHKVTLNADNQPVFTKKYSAWFPAGNFSDNSQGVIYEGKLYFLINRNELWSFDPNQITIDYTRPGTFTIVSL
jgi:hypothetical protein